VVGEATTLVDVPSLLTVSVVLPELPVKLVSALYVAVMVSLPTASDEMLMLAEPPLSVPVPRMVVPCVNVTVPVAVPEPGALAATVAVKVTAWPKADVVGEATTLVEVPSLLTVSVVLPELPLKLLSPL
jgi:hypothetical protein